MVEPGYWLANASLLIFFLALLTAGLIKGTYSGGSFGDMMATLEPFLLIFAIAGIGLMVGLWMVLLPALCQISALVFSARTNDPAAAGKLIQIGGRGPPEDGDRPPRREQ